ncbi:MAG TPA: SMC-Scp complex subunit ScpB [Thermoplasmata archaeon]
MNERALVEAALYSAGKALPLDEIVRVTGQDESAVKAHLRALSQEYTKRGSALEVTQIGSKWTMQIRSEYTERARVFAPPEIDRDLLKTAALVAYHQPILQSDLHVMVGDRVYEQTKALEDLGLISRKPSSHSFELTTTRYFAEFFGLKATNREGVRRIMAERAGIPYKEKAEPAAEEAAVAAPASDAPPPPGTPEAVAPAAAESSAITTS